MVIIYINFRCGNGVANETQVETNVSFMYMRVLNLKLVAYSKFVGKSERKLFYFFFCSTKKLFLILGIFVRFDLTAGVRISLASDMRNMGYCLSC